MEKGLRSSSTSCHSEVVISSVICLTKPIMNIAEISSILRKYKAIFLSFQEYYVHIRKCKCDELRLHCKAGEPNAYLKTASCKVFPGTMPMCTVVWETMYLWRLQIQKFADEWGFPNSIIGLLKFYLYSSIMKYLNLSCQGLNHHSLM
jgi:hypothetical protein